MWASQSRAGEVASLLLDCGASLEAEDDVSQRCGLESTICQRLHKMLHGSLG